MANQFASTSSANAAFGILKQWYAGPIVSQFNDMLPFWKQLQKGTEKWSGSQVAKPVKVLRNPGVGATSDGGLLPVIGLQTTKQAIIQARFNYLRFGITGPMLKASQGDKGAFINAMAFEMEEGLNDLKSDVNRQLSWDGTGKLATVSVAAAGSNVITVTGRESTEDGIKFLGDSLPVIDIVNAAGTALVASGIQITAISGTSTATLTLSSAVTVSANDYVIRSGSFGNEIQGMLVPLDGLTTTIFSIDRSAYPQFQGNVVNASAGQLTLDLMQQAYNQGRLRGGASVDYVGCDFVSERYYQKLLVANKRFVGKVAGDGTFSDKSGQYLEWGGVPVVPDKDFPTRFAFLDSKSWKKYVLAELEWADESGTPLIAQVSSDACEARLRFFANLFCEKPSAQAVLRNYISP